MVRGIRLVWKVTGKFLKYPMCFWFDCQPFLLHMILLNWQTRDLKLPKCWGYKTTIATRVKEYRSIKVINEERTNHHRRVLDGVLGSSHKCSITSIPFLILQLRTILFEMSSFSILITCSSSTNALSCTRTLVQRCRCRVSAVDGNISLLFTLVVDETVAYMVTVALVTGVTLKIV